MKKLLLKNSITGGFQYIASALLVFFTIPVFRNLLGHESYSIFALIVVLGDLNVLLDIGFSKALIRFLSAQGKSEESDIDIISSFSVILVLLILILAIFLTFEEVILTNLMGISDGLLNENIKYLFRFILISNLFTILGQLFKSILDSLQKIYITNYLQIFYNISHWSSILIILLVGGNLAEIGLGIIICKSIWFFFLVKYSLLNWGPFKITNFKKGFLKSIKKQFLYSSQIYTSSLLGFLFEPFSKILVSNFLGVNFVGYLDIALKIKVQIWGVLSKVLYPLYPLLAKENDQNKIRQIIVLFENKMMIFLVPILISFLFTINTLLEIWLSKEVILIAHSAIVLAIPFFLSILMLPFYNYLIAKGKAVYTIHVQMINVVVNLLIFFSLMKIFDYYAILVSIFFALFSSFVYLNILHKKFINRYLVNSYSDFLNLIILLVSTIISSIIFSFIETDLIRIIFTYGSNLILALLIIRNYKLLKKNELDMIFGSENSINDFLSNIFIR